MSRPAFSRLLPELVVTNLDSARTSLLGLGFDIESGSSQHAIMRCESVFVRLTQGEQISGTSLTIELAGHEGLEAYRASIQAGSLIVSDIAQVGWGKRKFSVTMQDGHVITFTQAKQIYQG